MSQPIHKTIIDASHGFFSDFLTSVNTVLYCHESSRHFYIDWHNWRYQDDDANLYDRYFHQEDRSAGPFEVVHRNLTPYGAFFRQYSGLTDKEICCFLYYPAQTLVKYGVFNNPVFTSFPRDYFGGKKVLGFHKRGTDHGCHGPITSNDTWTELVQAKLKSEHFDNVFCISDEVKAIEHFKREFGSMLLYTDSLRSDNGWAIHTGHVAPSDYPKHKLAEQVLRDALLLSLCDYQMFARSNVSTFVVLYDMTDPNFDMSRIHFVDGHLNFNN